MNLSFINSELPNNELCVCVWDPDVLPSERPDGPHPLPSTLGACKYYHVYMSLAVKRVVEAQPMMGISSFPAFAFLVKYLY